MDLSVGSLDDPSVLTPVSHYAIETRVANWHCEDALPGHRLDENEQIVQRWAHRHIAGQARRSRWHTVRPRHDDPHRARRAMTFTRRPCAFFTPCCGS